MAFRQLSRQSSRYISALLLVVASLSLGGYMASMAASLDQWLIDRVYYEIGSDLAFTQSIVDSVDRVAEGRDLQVDITDGTFVVEDAAAAIRGYADDGYDLVIAHGSQYGSSLQEIAPDFPEVSFAWGTSVDTFGLENVYAYTPASDQGGYVNGTIAAALTESSVVGVVGPIEVGDAKLYVDGFAAGVASVSPDIEVNINYIDSFSDVALASEAATAHVANGADVLTGTAQMVVGATGVASDEGIPWFGTQSNQTALGEDIVVASQVYHWEVALEQIIDGIGSGTLGGESFVLTFENGGLVMEYNDAYPLDDAVKAAAEETAAGIADGSISTGVE
jgi:basic membrane protein A